MKSILENYDSLISQLQETQAQIAHVARADYPAHQQVINRAGVAVIEFEHQHKINEARYLVEHEKFIDPQLKQFEDMASRYAEPVDWPALVASGEIAADEIEARMAARATVLVEVKKSVVTLTRMHLDAAKRRKTFSPECLKIAARQDPLGRTERDTFTELFNYARAGRATREVSNTITKKEPALA